MASGRNTADFDWHMWGPEGTRMMLTSEPSTSFRSDLVKDTFPCGARHVSTGRPTTQPVDSILIYDFNQYALRWSEQNKKENTAGESEANIPSSYANITAPTKIVNYEIFQDEIETRLGYRTKRRIIPGEPKVRYSLCVEDAIGIWVSELEKCAIYSQCFMMCRKKKTKHSTYSLFSVCITVSPVRMQCSITYKDRGPRNNPGRI